MAAGSAGEGAGSQHPATRSSVGHGHIFKRLAHQSELELAISELYAPATE